MLTVKEVIETCAEIIENPETPDTLRDLCIKELFFFSPNYFQIHAEKIAAATFADSIAAVGRTLANPQLY